MSQLLTIKNKATGATYPVSEEEWAKMEEAGRGTKLFTVERTEKARTVTPFPAVKTPIVPPEVQRVKAKTDKAALPETHETPEQNA